MDSDTKRFLFGLCLVEFFAILALLPLHVFGII